MKELDLQLQELDELLDEQLVENEEFDWEFLVDKQPLINHDIEEYEDSYWPDDYTYEDDCMSLDDYEEEDMCWNEDKECNFLQRFQAEHGIDLGTYITQCNELYTTIGIPSQYAKDISDTMELAYRELQIQNIIDEGRLLHHLDIYTLIRFCDNYLNPEERYNAVKYYFQ